MPRIAGSFRDPCGFVFGHGDRIFRALDATATHLIRELDEKGFLAQWVKDGLVVGTRFVDDQKLLTEFRTSYPGFSSFLEHDKIPCITYPYEWSPSMLADAGRLTLRFQGELLRLGLSLKDATAYNIQFVGGRPIFIDLASIEKPTRLDIWFALGQFNRMFLYPLLLMKYAGWDLRSYFLSNLDGRSTLQVGQAFSFHRRWSPSLLFDVGLPYALERRVVEGRTHAPKPPVGNSGVNPMVQQMTIRRLERKIKKMAESIVPQTIWGDYTKTCSYDTEAEFSKKERVKEYLRQTSPDTVLDIGCNSGDYSRIAAACGARVCSTDFDIGAVEQMYRQLKICPADILPMVVDIANPSPGIGFMNRERETFLERAKTDCVMALAVIHHLLVGANLSMEAICELFASLTRKHLILEFVPTDDVMFRKLIEFRVDLFGHITLDNCLAVFGEKFVILRQESIRNSPRTLLLFERRFQ